MLAALHSHMDGNKQAYGLQSVYMYQVPDFATSDPPYAVITYSGSLPDETSNFFREFTVDITIVTLRNSEQQQSDVFPHDVADAIDGHPTAGLHRLDLNITDANTRTVSLLYQGESTVPTDDPDRLLALNMTYTLKVQEV